MNNEPVAWIGKPELQFGFTDTRVTNEKESWDDIPLYTHPAKTEDEGKVCARCGAIAYDPVIIQTAKTLIDEEIDMLAHEYNCIDDYPHEFVRACIRKAQENERK